MKALVQMRRTNIGVNSLASVSATLRHTIAPVMEKVGATTPASASWMKTYPFRTILILGAFNMQPLLRCVTA